MAEAQNDPLLPGYSFNAHLVAGLTPIEANGYLDFFIDRPLGMKGYILNLTIRGQGVVKNQGREFVCRPGDILLFPPGEIHHYGRHPEAHEWYHQWVYFRPRAYWHEWLNWPSIFANTGFFRPDEAHQPHFSDLFGQIINAGQGEGRYSELLAINLLEQLLLRRMEAINESLHPPMDNRVREACQYISDHLADSNFDIASVAQHVCLSPSRLSHLFRQQLGISVLSWREDQRISQAKLLLSTPGCLSPPSVAMSVLTINSISREYLKNAPGRVRASLGLDVNNKKEGGVSYFRYLTLFIYVTDN